MGIWPRVRRAIRARGTRLTDGEVGILRSAMWKTGLSFAKKGGRRWLQFRLRTMLLLFLVVSMPLGWFGQRLRQSWRDRDAAEAIRRLGFAVTYEQGGRGPDWARALLGDQFFLRVSKVGPIGGKWISHAQMIELRIHLNRLSRIPMFDGGHEWFDDFSLAQLQGLDNLEGLNLRGSEVTDDGLTALKDLPNLKKLTLGEKRITDAGLGQLKHLKRLQSLSICGPDVTNAGLTHLKNVPSVRDLEIYDTQVDDAGLVHVKDLPQLRALKLVGNKITGTGLMTLESLRQLERVYVYEWDVWGSAVDRLQRALPDAEITSDHNPGFDYDIDDSYFVGRPARIRTEQSE